MLIKTIEFEDYNGNQRKETFYFNLSKAELLEMNLSKSGGLENYYQKMIDAQDGPTMFETFKEILLKSYGKPSDDGRRFIKSKAASEEFEQTEAYSNLLMEFMMDQSAIEKFMNGILPKMDNLPSAIPPVK